MRKRILQSLGVMAIGFGAFAASPNAIASAALVSCPPKICVSQCPPYPELVCQGWGCLDSTGCSTDDCGSQEYTVNCVEHPH